MSNFVDKKIFNFDPNYLKAEDDLKKCLQDFDASWAQYEQFYVYELMVIETDARRFVIEAIQIERELQAMENTLKHRGLTDESISAYNSKRSELLEKMASVNTVCNANGKGRDDLVDIEILTAAEELPTLIQEG